MRMWGASLAAVGVLLIAGLTASPGQAQFTATTSPVPDGLKPGQPAPFPKGHYKDLDARPDWGGIWFRTFDPKGPRPPQPKLKGKYLDAYNAWKQEVAANHGEVKSESSHCTPPGMPGIMQIPQYPYEFLFTPGRVTINQEAWMQTRHIWTDGRKHQDDPDPSFMGDSIGHWEGGTLVADTIAIKDSVMLGMGMGHSDKLHLIERIHLKPGDPTTLIDEMTYEDPDALAEPYHVAITYKRDRYGSLLEFECAENDRNPVDANGDTEFK